MGLTKGGADQNFLSAFIFQHRTRFNTSGEKGILPLPQSVMLISRIVSLKTS